MQQYLSFFYFFIIAAGAFSQEMRQFAFIENKGQVHDQQYKSRPDVLFSGSNGGMVFHLREKCVSYQLCRVDSWKEEKFKGVTQKLPSKTTIYRVDINWLNSTFNEVVKGDQSSDHTNYYLDNCKGITGVHSYSDLIYKNIYEGIDLKWYQKNGELEYDFILAPGADPSQIKMEIKGAKKIAINNKGELIIETPLGTIIEKAPQASQNGKAVRVKWQTDSKNIISFKIENYDRASELVIDPAVRVWGTYYGGAQNDFANGLATDVSGNVFIGGYTQSNSGTALATSGSYQSTYGGGTNDGYLAKLNSSGVRQWGTYYGGSTLDAITACAVDGSGNIYVTGYTDSGNGIATAGSHQPAIGGIVDGFLAKFDNNGILQWGTYYGGAANDFGYGVAVSSLGNVFIGGYTASTGGTDIATATSWQPVHGGSTLDAFLAKFNSNGVRQWGTYYGGSGAEYGYGCSADNSGNVVLTGKTSSAGFAISSAGAHQVNNGGGNYDAFAVKFDGTGNRLWGTYYGGFGDEVAYASTFDANGNIFISGSTDSNSSISTAGSHQPTIGGGFGDAYLVKFNSAGTRQWATYYGGANYEEAVAVSTDPAGDVFITGQTSSQTGTIMATAGTYQSTFAGGNYDAYLAKFDQGGVRQWGTYYGGSGDDYGLSCKADASNNIYVSGKTSTPTSTALASAGAHQTTYGGGTFDGFVVKFFECPDVSLDLSILDNVSCNSGNDGSAAISLSGGSSFTYTWLPVGATTQTVSNLSAGDYTCVVTNNCGATNSVTFSITEPSPVNVNAITSNTLYCAGGSSTLTATGSGGNGTYTYTWSNGATSSSIVVTPTSTSVYTVTVADYKNCTAMDSITQNVISCAALKGNSSNARLLVSPNPSNGVYLINSGATNYKVILYNSLGETILQKDSAGSIDITFHPGGIYFLQVFYQENATPVLIKLIKQ